ncbi:MAG TPA: SUMF1/EgtB/PvdO family nonheme iron enzyme [Bryobacteraceae bacterium]|nr:SUMF1/EgtB/PvdO family nonheme iron enzyme [Bryobacteraceae bacterium]
MARSALAGLVFLAAALAAQQQDSSFREAGVCSRCHVVQVIEWSASKHAGARTVCQNCHGPSQAHVANERNEVKPDRLPRGEREAAVLCASCHAAGCPKTGKSSGCLSCHHQHALSNPNDKQLRQTAVTEDPRRALFLRHMAEGERHATRKDWRAARDAFTAALGVSPSDRRAASRARMAERRLNPAMPGLEILGGEFDAESGLPLRVRVQAVGIEMLLVPGGEEDIGSERWSGSRPVHSVRGEPFYLGKYEVTQQEWSTLGMENPSQEKGARIPVHGISWNEAQKWISLLNARVAGGGFRLPAEAEWERAATTDRGSTETAVGERAWFRENSVSDPAGGGFREAAAYRPRAVGLKRPNAKGFFDMQGNVAEWCSSLFRPYPYDARDGREALAGEGLRVIRGGAFVDSTEYLDPAFRHGERPDRRNPWTGLRLAR